ncbi:hypothetical protein [Alicyclobacillus sp. SO9]|uniref:hypothetical protein n=1 Tax=Alicyclobacillus sp. SO9 TaxID=2665646 RepID=UPI0018E7F5A7|nr:hypothetical protein [Alicyclobacillus sp. SO9]QQE78426.1 hypothetical protein GI364_21540 [Alicyclobacillus sp. SO9]
MSKALAFLAAGIVVGAGAFSLIAPRAFADTTSTSSNSGFYQQMTQFMDSPQGQQMLQECNSYTVQGSGGSSAS